MTTPQKGDHQEAGLACGAGRDLQQSWIPPERLSGEEVDAVLAQVDLAFGGIELKVQCFPNLYLFSDPNAPFQGVLSAE